MKNLFARTRLTGLALALALVAQPVLPTIAPTEAHADIVKQEPLVTIATGGGSNGGWLIAGVFISIASIMTCAAIVGAAENRELTLEEAWAAGLIPLSCLFTTEFGDDNS
ncbi:MAG: hypothetical protein ACFB01_09290 [Cohaesibacteraceae bacterium]